MNPTWKKAAQTAALGLTVVLALMASPTACPTHTGLWDPPLGHPLRISETYSLPNGPYRAGHRGIDLPATVGDPVRAPVTGTVSFVGKVVDRPVLSIRIDEHTTVSFEPVTSDLSEGDPVFRGGVFGSVGARETTDGAEHCATACLHLGVRVDGEYVNPLRFLRSKPVLLPW